MCLFIVGVVVGVEMGFVLVVYCGMLLFVVILIIILIFLGGWLLLLENMLLFFMIIVDLLDLMLFDISIVF